MCYICSHFGQLHFSWNCHRPWLDRNNSGNNQKFGNTLAVYGNTFGCYTCDWAGEVSICHVKTKNRGQNNGLHGWNPVLERKPRGKKVVIYPGGWISDTFFVQTKQMSECQGIYPASKYLEVLRPKSQKKCKSYCWAQLPCIRTT